jgi:hypothetical protein
MFLWGNPGGCAVGSILVRLNRNMVRLKSPASCRKQRIGLGFNRNKNEGSVFVFFEFAGGFLALEIMFWRVEHGGSIGFGKSASISRLERSASLCFV